MNKTYPPLVNCCGPCVLFFLFQITWPSSTKQILSHFSEWHEWDTCPFIGLCCVFLFGITFILNCKEVCLICAELQHIFTHISGKCSFFILSVFRIMWRRNPKQCFITIWLQLYTMWTQPLFNYFSNFSKYCFLGRNSSLAFYVMWLWLQVHIIAPTLSSLNNEMLP